MRAEGQRLHGKGRTQGHAEGRDRPSADVTSGLSPHLAHGEITPFQILAALKRKKATAGHEGREKFDPEGIYVRRFMSALAKMPSKYIHRPWEAPKEVLAQAGVKSDYPVPVIDRREARALALKAYKSM